MSVEAPVAPAPPPTMGSAMPSSRGEINAAAMTGGVAPAPKPITPTPPTRNLGQPVLDDGKTPMGKTRQEEMNDRLLKRSKLTNTPPEPAKPAEPAKAEPGKAEASGNPELEPGEGEEGALPAKPVEDPVKAAEKLEQATDKKKGINPWHKIKEVEGVRKQLEAEIADLRKQIADPEARKKEFDRLSNVEKRNQELEEKIRFVDYKESAEFQEKYQAPYEQAWHRAMSELKDLTVEDANGNSRPMSPNDLLDLVNMPLREARDLAEERYGGAANEVMAYRKELRGLYENQAIALEKAKKDGVAKGQRDTEQRQMQMKAASEESNKYWEEYNKAILDNAVTGKYFKPVEGNPELNNRLEAGYKFVDETMAMNPMNPNLTSDQRKEAVRRHASLRSRAAAFGRLRHELEASQSENANLKKKLGEFEESVPNLGGSVPNGGAPLPTGNRMSALEQRLLARAK